MSKNYFGQEYFVDPLDTAALDGLSFTEGGYPGPKRFASTNLFTEAGFTFDLDWEKPIAAQSDPDVLTIPSTTTFNSYTNDSESVADYIRMVNGGLVNIDRTVRAIKGLPKRPEYAGLNELGLPKQNQDNVGLNERTGETYGVFDPPEEKIRIAGQQGRQGMEAPSVEPVPITPTDVDQEPEPTDPDYYQGPNGENLDRSGMYSPEHAQQLREQGFTVRVDGNGEITSYLTPTGEEFTIVR